MWQIAGITIDFQLFPEILEGYKAVAFPTEEDKKSQRSLWAQLEAVADMKFTYIAACQNYGIQKQNGDRRATDILNLMVKYVLCIILIIYDVSCKHSQGLLFIFFQG